MRWSWWIGRLVGIDIYMHVTFPLLLAWIAYVRYSLTQEVAAAVWGVFFVLVLFSIVVLHELGHALAARRYGIPTRDITLLPIGGVARLERMPEEPSQEMVVALAGPAVNAVLLAILFPILYVTEGGVLHVSAFFALGGDAPFLDGLFWANAIILGFNLLPSYPMDGGRVLRALLAMRMDYVQATRYAATVGQFMAILFGIVGLLIGHIFLLLIAFFVYMGAAQEAAAVETRAILRGVPVKRAMITDFRTLAPHDNLALAMQHILAGFQQDFPVVDAEGQLVGVLTRNDLMGGLARYGQEGLVRDCMHEEFKTAEPYETLDTALPRLQECSCNALPVLRRGELVGIVTMENLSELLMIQDALRQAPRFPESPLPPRSRPREDQETALRE